MLRLVNNEHYCHLEFQIHANDDNIIVFYQTTLAIDSFWCSCADILFKYVRKLLKKICKNLQNVIHIRNKEQHQSINRYFND